MHSKARHMRKDAREHSLLGPAIVILVLLVAFAHCTLTRRSRSNVSWQDPPQDNAYLFDRDKFLHDNGRYTYEDGSVVARRTGVDVADHEGHIDWEAVANDGIEFAFIRIGYRGNTEGLVHEDELFEENLTAAQNAGLACGTYFYSQALNEDEAREEAAFVIDRLGSRQLEYPVVFDYELGSGHRIADVDEATATACVRAFCEAIRDAGYTPMLYGNNYDLRRISVSELPDYPIWFAEYGSTPSYEDAFAIWQYSESGHVNGIDSNVDLNLDLSEALQALSSASEE